MKVIIMRGVPGSGKSTYARYLCPDAIVSADDYFIVDSQYKFDPKKLGMAHKKCMQSFLKAIKAKLELIIVDNTNTTPVEIAPYVAVGEAEGYEVEILQFNVDPEKAFERCLHEVPLSSVIAMNNRMVGQKLPPWWTVRQIGAV